MGVVGDLRGDHQRSRRRPGLHRALERPAAPSRTGTSSRYRRAPPRRGPVHPAADQERRTVRPRGRVVRPQGRASSTSPRTTSASRPASTATRRPRTRWRSASSGTAAPCTCCEVKGVPNAHLEGDQVAGHRVRRRVGRDRPAGRPLPLHAGAGRADREQHALVHVGSQGWAKGAAFFSRLEGQVFSKGDVFFTSTQGGGAAEPDLDRGRRRRLRQRHRPGVGLRPQARRGCGWSTSRRTRATLDFPDNITTSNRGHAGGLRGQRQRQLHPRPLPRGRPVGHRPEPAHQQHGRQPVRTTSSPASTFSHTARRSS